MPVVLCLDWMYRESTSLFQLRKISKRNTQKLYTLTYSRGMVLVPVQLQFLTTILRRQYQATLFNLMCPRALPARL
jgi:hypothetical protein